MQYHQWVEVKDIETKWESCGLLKGATDIKALALCLEAQRLYNEQLSEMTSTASVAQFQRISIPLVRRIFASNLWNGTLEPEKCKKKHVFETKFNYAEYAKTIKSANHLDFEAEWTAVLTQSIIKELQDKFDSPIVFGHLEQDGENIVMYYENMTASGDIAVVPTLAGIGSTERVHKKKKKSKK